MRAVDDSDTHGGGLRLTSRGAWFSPLTDWHRGGGRDLADLDPPLAHQYAFSAHVGRCDDAVAFLDSRFQNARPTNLHSLRDAIAVRARRRIIVLRQHCRERAVRASGRRILRHAIERREHSTANVELVTIMASSANV